MLTIYIFLLASDGPTIFFILEVPLASSYWIRGIFEIKIKFKG